MSFRFSRRRFLASASALAAAGAGAPAYGSAPSPSDLARFDPFSSVENYFSFMRPIMFDYKLGRPYLDALWSLYGEKKVLFDGERVLMGMFILWRTIESMAERVRFSRAAQKMADLVAQHHPQHPAGHIWGAIFFGTETLSAGVLESVHLAPAIQRRLDQAIATDETYLFGLPHLLAAKMYFKAPSFPVSVGSFEKAYRHIELAKPYAERKFAPWYIILAEGELLAKRTNAAAFAVLDRMQLEIKPTNTAEAYGLDSMLTDAAAFREAVETKKYNKYFWDSFLQMAKPGLP